MDDAVWANMAVIGRDELRAAGEAVHSTAPPSAHGTVTTATAGGGAFKFRRTQFSERVGFALAIRHHLWLDHDLSAKRAVIHRFGSGRAAYPEGRHGKGWDRAIETVFETGEVAALDDTTAIDNQLEWLAREQPRYLLTSPGNLERLARHAIGNGTRIAGLRATETTGGVPGPGLRALVREAWGVPVQDHYSTPETGCIALQCPETDHYHAAAEGALVEILDGDGRPCEPGETGRVVVTPLHNFATPLLRYDTGHRAESGAPDCRCGRTLPVLNRIEG
jgi:phenylacetate-CoA ligase